MIPKTKIFYAFLVRISGTNFNCLSKLFNGRKLSNCYTFPEPGSSLEIQFFTIK